MERIDYFGEESRSSFPYSLDNFLGNGGMSSVYKVGNQVAKITEITSLPFSEHNQLISPVKVEYYGEGFLKVNDHVMYLDKKALMCLQRSVGEHFILQEMGNAGNIVQPGSLHFVNYCGSLCTINMMRYVPGSTLNELLNEGFSSQDSGKAIADTADALAQLAKNGIIHRDIKPNNIIYNPNKPGEGEATVLDFGLAIKACGYQLKADIPLGLQQLLEERLEEQRRSILGTPGYLAPEQARGGEATTKTDVFALGLLAYKLFTGEDAFPRFPLDDEINIFDNLFKLATYNERRRSGFLTKLREKNLPKDLVAAVGIALDEVPEWRMLDPLREEAHLLASGTDNCYEVQGKEVFVPTAYPFSIAPSEIEPDSSLL